MTTTKTPAAPYVLATAEDDDGKKYPSEALFTPGPARPDGFHLYDGVLVTGVGEEGEPPDEFVALGHGYTQTKTSLAAESYARAVLGWRCLYDGPGADSASWIGRTFEKHAVFICHPHPDYPCGCEWDDTWRLAYVAAGHPGAIAVTVLKRPGARR